MAEIKVIFEGMTLIAHSAEDLVEIAKAQRLLNNGNPPIASTRPSDIAIFIAKLPNSVVEGFKALVENEGYMEAEALQSVFDAKDNSVLGARFVSPVRRVGKNLGFNSEQILRKVLVRGSHGEVLKYRIPSEHLEEVKEALVLRQKRDD